MMSGIVGQVRGRVLLGLAAVALLGSSLLGGAQPAAAGELSDHASKLSSADISVTTNQLYYNNGTHTGTFLIWNHGPDRAVNVNIHKEGNYRRVGTNEYMGTTDEADIVRTIEPGKGVAVSVSCTDVAGKYCSSLFVSASYSLDPKKQNNQAAFANLQDN